jgi:hypothetical protein
VWTCDLNLTSLEAAELFAREAMDGRLVDRSTVKGGWKGKRYLGTFRLVDGTRPYLLRHDGERWSAEAAPENAP